MKRVALGRTVYRRSTAQQEGSGRKPSKARGADHRLFFRAGETIPESGIYEVVHQRGHRATHEAVLVKGDPFPLCDICEAEVRFRVVRTAPYIFDDEDFES